MGGHGARVVTSALEFNCFARVSLSALTCRSTACTKGTVPWVVYRCESSACVRVHIQLHVRTCACVCVCTAHAAEARSRSSSARARTACSWVRAS